MRTTICGRLLLVLILCLVQSASQAQQSPLFTMKWTTVPGTPLPMVRATLSDGKSRLFAVTPVPDNTFLDRNVAQDLHLKVSTTKQGEFVTSSLELGAEGLYLDKVPFVLTDLTVLQKQNPEVAGIIGSNILGKFTVRLDYSKQQMDLLLGSVAGTPYLPKDTTRIPLTKANDQYYLKATLDGKVVRFLIDPGVDRASLRAADLKSLKPKAVLKLLQTGVENKNGAHTNYSSLLRLNSLQFGGMTVNNPIFDAWEMGSDDTPSKLGNDFFKRYHVVLDFPASALYLTPDPAFQEDPQEWVSIGLSMDQTKSNLIDGVFSPSPAEEAGIAKGDEIVSFEGHPLKGLSAAEVSTLIHANRQLGSTVTLEVLPANQSQARTVKLQPRSLL